MSEPKTEPKNIEVAFTVKTCGHAIGDKVKVSASEPDRPGAEHLAKRTAKSAT